MSDMRLIVAGAGGRMGRVLVKTISQTKGAVLTGALEAPSTPRLGPDWGVLARLPANAGELRADLGAGSTASSISPCRRPPSPTSLSPPSAGSCM